MSEPDLSAELDAAEAIVMGGAEAVVTEWGLRTPSGYVTKIGSGEDAAAMARTLAGDWEQEGHPGALVRRTVTYSPREVPGDSG